ncbi:TetR family transcriptional regulator [Streptomyces chartreusis]
MSKQTGRPQQPARAEATSEEAPQPSIREDLVAAAFDLFTEFGYDATTIDDIVRRAGVSRRSFFRYFPTKESIVFPDHEQTLAEMVDYLNAGSTDPDPVGRACNAARLVVRMYATNAEFSVRRYGLTRSVHALKTHEISVVWQYERALASYLQRRFATLPEGGTRAYVTAAAVVAAHNYGLRAWLRSGGIGDAVAVVDAALDLVHRSWSTDAESVVIVARADAPMWQVVRQLEDVWPRHPEGR